MRLRLFPAALLALAALWGCDFRPQPGEGEAVVLVHGLGRTERSMSILGQRLEWAGYQVETVGYASRRAPLEEHAETLREAVERCCSTNPKVHFVGHSLGGIVIRHYLSASPPEALGRVVLLAPPSQGSELADWLEDLELAREALGPTGIQLGTDSTDLPATLAPPSYEMGIITGNRSLNPIGSIVIPGPDDGMVGVRQTHVDGVPMLVLPRSHTFIMHSRFTADGVMRFLKTGSFEAGDA